MIKKSAIVLAIIAALAVAAVAYAFLKPAAEASQPIEAVPIQLEATAAPSVTAEAVVEPEPTDVVDAATAEPVAEPSATVAATAEATAEATATESPAASAPLIFEIQQGGSQARYQIDEVLRGAPVTVVGATDQVAGQIALDPADPSTARVGTILINARTFATDESRRDNAVRNRVLFTDQYEYITFEPTSLVGLPESGTVGESYSFQIVGNLTIRDVTGEVTWDATVTPLSETELQGSARTTISRGDWGLVIPSVPFVANVSEEVVLELDFVATAQ